MLYNIFYGLFIIACIVMVGTVLLQPGKSDAGALFTSNISSTAFGPRGTQSVLARITIGAATAFMLLGFLLSQPALTGTRSVLETTANPAESPATTTASPEANANVAASPVSAIEPTTANSNTAVVINSNAAGTPAASNSNK